MLEHTLKWREEFRPDEITWDDMEDEAARGKVFVLDHPDKEGRPIVFMRPRKEKYGGDNDKRLRWVVYVMETASRVADASCTLKRILVLLLLFYPKNTSVLFRRKLNFLNFLILQLLMEK
jgi:hypothetical protein